MLSEFDQNSTKNDLVIFTTTKEKELHEGYEFEKNLLIYFESNAYDEL
jgi:hypothetical protein